MSEPRPIDYDSGLNLKREIIVGKKLTIINNKFLNCPFKTMKVVDTMDGSYMSWEFVEGSSGLSSIGLRS